MKSKKQKNALILPFPTPSNVIPIDRGRRSPQILTEVVASEGDRSLRGLDPGVTSLLVRQVVPVDELLMMRDQKNTPPDDLIA
jgi:hypothetical protein